MPEQTDPRPDSESIDVTVTAIPGHTDLAAIAPATLRAKPGDDVTFTVGIRNNGPYGLVRAADHRSAAVVVVTIPYGPGYGDVVEMPHGCRDVVEFPVFDHDGQEYICEGGGVLPAKTTVTWTFRVKLAAGVRDSRPDPRP